MATRIFNGALTANTVATVTFTARYDYVEVKNEDTANGMYVRADGTAAVVAGAAEDYYVGPGERCLIPNGLAMWWQGFGGPGGSSNPGTSVSIAGGTNEATSAYEVVGCG